MSFIAGTEVIASDLDECRGYKLNMLYLAMPTAPNKHSLPAIAY